MTRAILDANVLVSAAIQPGGIPARCMVAHAEGRFELVVSPRLLAELRNVLERAKFRPFLSLADAVSLVEALPRSATLVDDPPLGERVSRDPNDDYLIALARVSSAHVLVTGDADLLGLDLGTTAVATPRTFLELLPG